MPAYYNEHDPKAAAWLRELIRRDLIAPGEVDERSIADVRPDDLRRYTQCHFFAGIGVWSYALRLAGWADDRPVWTGSCPCQPFSVAGKGDEFGDERHLWPAWFRLIRESRPDAIFGEQVSSKDALAWIDHVRFDLEGAGYAVGILDTCAAGVGAPHIRQRLYFVAHSASRLHERRDGTSSDGSTPGDSDGPCGHDADGRGESGGMADAGLSARARLGTDRRSGLRKQEATRLSEGRVLGNSSSAGLAQQRSERRASSKAGLGNTRETAERTGAPVNGFWRDAVWLACRDGKARAIKPGLEPLVDGAPARVVRLRGYGNAICAPQAETFVRAYLDMDTDRAGGA